MTTDATTTKTTASALQSLIYNPNIPSLDVLDQLLLPHETKYISINDIQTTYRVIHDMNIRGKKIQLSFFYFSTSFYQVLYFLFWLLLLSHFSPHCHLCNVLSCFIYRLHIALFLFCFVIIL